MHFVEIRGDVLRPPQGTTLVAVKINNPIALKKAKLVYNFGLSECNGKDLTPIVEKVAKMKIMGLIPLTVYSFILRTNLQ